MTKRKLIFCAILFCFSINSVFSQNLNQNDKNAFISSFVAQRQAALRCAINAKNFIDEQNFSSALEACKIGLSYDDSVSDLWYEKAISLSKMEKQNETILNTKKYEVYESAKIAYELNDWIYFTQEQGKVLYAQALVDTHKNEVAYKILEGSFSSDVEYIRSQACYGMNDVAKARSIISSASRVFPDDERFAYLFFRTEYFLYFFKNEQNDNSAFEIAKNFLTKIQKFQNSYPDILFYASFFASQDKSKGLSEQDRLLRQFFSEKKITLESIYTGVQKGLLTQKQAYNYLVKFSENPMERKLFEKALSSFSENEIVLQVEKFLSVFSGTLLEDFNEDFYTELTVQYKDGRPWNVFADLNEDSNLDFKILLDFGFPVSATISKNEVEIDFASYPFVRCAKVCENTTFNFQNESFSWKPVDFIEKELFQGFSFYFVKPCPNKIPSFDKSEYLSLMQLSYYVLSTVYCDGNRMDKIFTIKDGDPIEILYKRDGKPYAKAVFEDGVIKERKVDSDFDSIYEITEFFDFDKEKAKLFTTEENSKFLYTELFGTLEAEEGLYICKVAFDYDGNGLYDCVDEFFENGSKITWYDGFTPTSSFEKRIQNGVEKETSILRLDNNKIILEQENGILVKLKDNFEEKNIVYDDENNIYFIGELPPDAVRELVADKIKEFPSENFFRTILPYEKDSKIINIMILRISSSVFAQCFE